MDSVFIVFLSPLAPSFCDTIAMMAVKSNFKEIPERLELCHLAEYFMEAKKSNERNNKYAYALSHDGSFSIDLITNDDKIVNMLTIQEMVTDNDGEREDEE